MRSPGLGQYIEHTVLNQYTYTGIVREFLSAQFVYITANGNLRIALYTEDWNPMGSRTVKQQVTVIAPSVWRDHQSRTCIVLEADEDLVKYIPLTVDSPFDIQECSNLAFRTQLYLEPIYYPVERAAKLFIGYARTTGATEEALKTLALFTDITNEDRIMAIARASRAAENAVPDKKRVSKKTATKKTATKKTATKKTATKKTATKKTATKKTAVVKKPRVSAASVYRDLITAGKSTKQIVAAVNKKFPGKGRADFVRWYWKKLDKGGAGIPEPKGLIAAVKAERAAKKAANS